MRSCSICSRSGSFQWISYAAYANVLLTTNNAALRDKKETLPIDQNIPPHIDAAILNESAMLGEEFPDGGMLLAAFAALKYTESSCALELSQVWQRYFLVFQMKITCYRC